MSDLLIAPSILSADFARLGEDVRALEAAGADLIHIDVMDQHFVPNLTMGPMIVGALAPVATRPLDVHLMIAPVDLLIPAFAKAGAAYLTIHPEAGPHLHRSLQLIRSLGVKPGVALNPATPLGVLDHVLDLVDLVLVMTVNPGFGGQDYIPLEPKIAEVRRRIDASGRPIRLEVDGGITPATIGRAVGAGADTVVAGTAIFRDRPDFAGAIARLRAAAGNTPTN